MKILYVCILLGFVSCQAHKDVVLYDASLDELKKYNCSFCVVLHDSTYNGQERYVEMLQELASEKSVINFVNVDKSENSWYTKILRPQILPITCVFGSCGDLLDVVPGDSKEGVLYVNDVIAHTQMNLEYHYNQRYGEDKKNLILLFDALIKYRYQFFNDLDVRYKNIADSIVKELNKHPYYQILKMEHMSLIGDTLAAQTAAKELLNVISGENIVTYHDDYFRARQILNPLYNQDTAPKISLDPIELDLGIIARDTKVTRILSIRNEGLNVLNIFTAITSCTCVRLKHEISEVEIYPNEELCIMIEFHPDRVGDLEREIYILSNSYCNPIVEVPIRCSVE